MLDFGIPQQKALDLEERMKKCGIKESELEETFVRSQGAGGQKVNKTSTCVQLRHLPTGLMVKMQKSRSRRLNRMLEDAYVNCWKRDSLERRVRGQRK
jgi:protein subunit release factor B